MTHRLRRDRLQVPQTQDLKELIRALNAVLLTVEARLSQVDAVGQNPDMKGRTLKNLGNLKDIVPFSDPSSATAAQCATKINEILAALK